MTRHDREAPKTEPNEAYLRLLRGEIDSKAFVKVVERSVGTDKQTSRRSLRRAATAES